ncbi:hypothetical protein RS130_17250 [Paraglaciecola aquimarina]|uniref:Cohesin domain-containing protein n=1 Tax=Paraglaciecola aquimarina TaxID=1235557 RepID=A0ABU3SZH8_9ALTE|nr:hypothetical protein [Paraglaciecola aquimarina]MDU0355419.1 hypothetical protein [Paraglaciecola aquimarina]
MKVLTPFVLVVSLMFANIANANVILSLETAQEYDLPGNVVSVTLMIDELGDYVPLSLSSFDIDITFDSTVFSFAGYSLFNELGNLDAAEALDFSWEEYLPVVLLMSQNLAY